MTVKRKRILVAPLDWGLGHAARCVPIINALINNNAEVLIAADRQPLAFLQKEFPAAETLCLRGYEISYPSSGSMALKMGFQIPKILSKIKEENKWLQKIIKEKNINGVISDQRFGLYTYSIPCVFITHQVMIKSPFFETVLYKINKSFIDRYTECWIPDFEGPENLSGDLSHKFPLPFNSKFIGQLSRFKGMLPTANCQLPTANNNIMAIISGPEPQRTVFEKIILSQLANSKLKAVVIRGIPNMRRDNQDNEFPGGDVNAHSPFWGVGGLHENIEIHSHLETNAMAEKILSSEIIISRPGYSTIMDLAAMKKKAILIPTPGQTEQEYLARYHYQKKHFFSTNQKTFDLYRALDASRNFHGIEELEFVPDFINTIRKFTSEC